MPYWVNTSSNSLINKVLREANSSIFEELSKGDRREFNDIIDYLLDGNFEEFSYELENIMLTNVSCFDFNSSSKESHYHVFILGMVLGLRRRYYVRSNRESGRGRYNLMIEPRDKSKQKNGLIIEFKVAENEEDLVRASEEALTQIESKKYDVELRDRGVENIIFVGMSFYQRNFKVMGYKK